MKTITDLKPQVKNSKRVSVYLNGAYYCGLDLLTVMQHRLKVGMDIEESKIVEIQKSSEFEACFDSALNIISKSVKTEKEILDKLTKKGYLKEIIDEVLVKLRSYGFADDKNYAERYISTYKGVKGKRLLALELRRKGVKEVDSQEVLDGIENEYKTALKIAEKYVKNKEKDLKTLQKCYKYLLSKGFSYEDSLTAAKQVLGDNDV